MDYYKLMEFCTQLGYCLAMSGAETFRVEDSINRIMAAYGIESEVFATTNNLIVSIETETGKPMTLMKRIGFHGNNLDGVEQFNALSRRICAEKPEPLVAMQWLEETKSALNHYSFPIVILGNMLGAAGYALFFGGGWIDFLWAALCGAIIGFITQHLNKLKVNPFFLTILNAFIVALIAYCMGALGLAPNSDSIIIGTFMILLPGLIFTNALRDIIYGDTNSGINRIMQVLLIAAACALGTGIAWSFSGKLFGLPVSAPDIPYSLLMQCLTASIGCVGFTILFNVHGRGSFLCIIGSGLTCAVYGLTVYLTNNDIAGYFVATVFISIYSEIIARIRKCPAICYLIVSLFPLIPGSGIYYTSMHLIQGNMSDFASQGTHTVAIAGALAVGILMVSTFFRLLTVLRQNKKS